MTSPYIKITTLCKNEIHKDSKVYQWKIFKILYIHLSRYGGGSGDVGGRGGWGV